MSVEGRSDVLSASCPSVNGFQLVVCNLLESSAPKYKDAHKKNLSAFIQINVFVSFLYIHIQLLSNSI